MPLTSRNLSSDTGGRTTGGLTGVLTVEASSRPSRHEQNEQTKITLNDTCASCSMMPSMGPTDMAMLLARP